MAEVKHLTDEEIARLPRWAQVAFAARCARRVQPLFTHHWPDAPKKHVDAIEHAIAFAEDSASVAAANAAAVANAAFIASAAASATANAVGHAAAVATAAHAAFLTVSQAIAATDAHAAFLTVSQAIAATAAHAFAATVGHAVIFKIRSDFDFLYLTGESEKWDDDTPVPPEFFGPMWPNGAPDGWPRELAVDETHLLKLQIAVPQYMDDTQSRDFNEKVKAFFIALSAFDASMGGTGLQILDVASNKPVDAESEEPIERHARPLAKVGA